MKNIFKRKSVLKLILPGSYFLILVYQTGCASNNYVYNPVQIQPRTSWEANPPKPFQSHIPEKITIHHEGTFFDGSKETAEQHIKKVQVWGMGPERNWIDIPYHFLIGHDGAVYEGRSVFTVGETNTEYNPSGHLLISLLGNFEEQEVPEKQLFALIDLLVYSCEKFNIPPDSIRSHKDYATTLCPGKNLYKYISSGYIISEVKKVLYSPDN